MHMQPSFERALRVRSDEACRAGPRARMMHPAGLSEREVQVLRLVAAGKSNRQVAEELVISTNTAICRVSNILAKTGAANRTEAATYATKHGLV